MGLLSLIFAGATTQQRLERDLFDEPTVGGEGLTRTQPMGDSSSFSHGVSCAQVQTIAEWSLRKYGGPNDPNLGSNEFASQVLKKILEKLDPSRLLLTQKEAESFVRRGIGAWPSFIHQNSCSYFEKWIHDSYSGITDRFKSRLKNISIDHYFPETSPDLNNKAVPSDLKLPSYKEFATDENELSGRMIEFVKTFAAHSTKELIAAYHGNRKRLITELLEQAVFVEKPESGPLLMKALLSAVDPYSTYFSPTEFDEFYDDLAGGTSGIGVRVRRVPEGYLVEKILKGAPAERSRRIKVGDIFIAVNGESASEEPGDNAKRLLKGPEGSEVRLTVFRPSTKKIQQINLVRKRFAFDEARIKYQVMGARKRGQGAVIAIDIPSFYGHGDISLLSQNRSSSEDLARILREIKPLNPRAVVLDLRGNPGGFLEEAVQMAGLFLGDQPVVQVVEKHGRRILRDLHHPVALYRGPLVVLVDEETASASEVLAGALRDYGRAIVVGGAHTYGKGSVQRLFHLDQDLGLSETAKGEIKGVVKVTTSIYFSPSGHTPANGGISADIALPHRVSSAAGKVTMPQKTTGKVADVLSFRDGTLSQEFSAREALLKEGIRELNKRSKRRVLPKAELDDDEVLDETASLAVDYAELSRRLEPRLARLRTAQQNDAHP